MILHNWQRHVVCRLLSTKQEGILRMWIYTQIYKNIYIYTHTPYFKYILSVNTHYCINVCLILPLFSEKGSDDNFTIIVAAMGFEPKPLIEETELCIETKCENILLLK